MLVLAGNYAAFAAAERVVFYPSGAEYSCVTRAQVKSDENGEYVLFTLTGQASPDTFIVASRTDGVAVNDVSWTSSRLSLSPDAQDTGRKIDQLKFKLATILAEKKAVDGGISFWNEQGAGKEIRTSELEKISGMVVGNLTSLYEKAAGLDVKIRETGELIKELERKLAEMSGPGRKIWLVRVSVAAGGVKSAEFRIGYMLGNCGWTPKYKIDAFPDPKEVRFSFEAEIRQGSGMDFKNCEVALATVKKRSRISPPSLSRWVIAPRKEPEARFAFDAAEEQMAVAMAPRMVEAKAAANVREIKATYSLWQLGKKTIPAGSTRKFAVESETWKSEFSFMARPSLSPDVFVSAKSVLEEAKDYPQGEAIVFMEGAMIGKQHFVFAGKEKEMFFGSDPMLKAERKTLEKQSGEKGLFGSKQTYNWKYAIQLENSRRNPVKITVQEAAPISGDKRIKLESSTNPTAKVEDNNFEWQVDVPAGGKADIEYSVQMKAPDDMKLNLGSGQ